MIAVAIFCTALGVNNHNSVNAATGNEKQVLINNNIQRADSYGSFNNSDYTNFYNVRNLFDNNTDAVSSWSQYGHSGWGVGLQTPLQKNVCSVEIDAYNPKNTPFNFKIGNNETVSEVNANLDNTKELVNIDNCIKNVTALAFVSSAPGNWTTLQEVKLFTNETGDIPDVEPPVCKPNEHLEDGVCVPNVEPGPEEPVPTGNITKLTINNSTVLANITDSKVVLNSSGDSQVIVNNAENPNTLPLVPMTDDQTKEEKEELEEEEEEREQQMKEDAAEDKEEEEEEDDKNGDDDKN